MSSRPGRRNSVKDSIKKIFHIPTRTYVPLPVGGYPLPGIIKRRFTLPPRLPTVNHLSTISDFTSSLYGEKWWEEIQKSLRQANSCRPRAQNSSDTLRVRYSTLVPEELVSSGSLQIPCVIHHNTPGKTRTLRRVRGHEHLVNSRTRSFASPAVSTVSGRTRADSFAQVYELDDSSSETTLVDDDSEAEHLKNGSRPISDASQNSVATIIYMPANGLGAQYSRKGDRPFSDVSIDSVEQAIYKPANASRAERLIHAARPISDASIASTETVIYAPQKAEREQNILTAVTEYVPHLFSSFCILDLQIPGYPIRVTTVDLLPQETVSEGEAFFLDDSDLEDPWQFKTTGSGANQTHHIIIQGDLMDTSCALASASHRFTARLDATDLIRLLELDHDSDVLDNDYDVWLALAHEEMDRLGIHRTIRSEPQTSSTTSASTHQKDKALQVLQNLHKDYFILGPSGDQTGEYCITHISPSLSSSMYPGRSNPLESLFDVEALRGSLNKGERFVARTVSQGPESPKRLYCLPMFGPELTCFLCFLVDGELRKF